MNFGAEMQLVVELFGVKVSIPYQTPQNWGPDPEVLYFQNRLWRGKNPCYVALEFAQVIFLVH